MIINLIDNTCTKILLFLAISPGSRYSRKEIQEKTKIYNIPLDNSLNMLSNSRIITEERRLYSLNLQNKLVILFLEEIKNFFNLPLKLQFEIFYFIKKILKFKGISNIILFGSYSKLIFSEKSDVDIAVIFRDKLNNKGILEKKINKITDKISKKYKKEIQIHFFENSELKHKEDPLIKDILRNGIRGI